MSPEVVSILLLAVMFVLATWRGVNMGVLGFVAAFALGSTMLGMDVKEIWAGFPVDLFVSLLGLTFLFGFAQNNGAIEVLVGGCMKLIGRRHHLAPWIFFALTAVLIACGALFAVAIITPLALSLARRNRMNQLMMGLLVVHGALAGAFSPISVYGVFINGYLEKQGLPTAPLSLFAIPFVLNVLFALVTWFVLRGRDDPEMTEHATRASAVGSTAAAAGAVTRSGRLNRSQLLTLTGLAIMVVLVLIFNLNIGVVCLGVGIVLACISPSEGTQALKRVSWSVLVLITGVLTYIAVLESAGTVEWVSGGIQAIAIPLIAALLLFYLAGFVSALASSLGIIGVVIALAVPFLKQSEVSIAGFVAALAFSATIVDISPFSTNGAMLLANVDERIRDWYYRRMLIYAGLMCLIGPAVGWLVAAVPTWAGMR
ncbi:hypothetical protein F8O07_08000 [Pseudoclavibacter sp. CFCC 13796]|uniref:SLC13 family permease n=1 Tax=Pseudoclavibacter sp. CFCC 13796 TaxID=2615179 RepID=UPI0013012D68|nr:SLC13 family permease [Pseudoclavibacter sp. CFCC 13796]KAB1661819.1 hypothetical protein F8O07_08000 [Pseudoclavibacter sp. CFCC 13796]